MQWNKVGKLELTPYDNFFNEFPFGILVILVVFSAKPGTHLLHAIGRWTRSRSAVACMTPPSYLWCLLPSAWGCNLVQDRKECERLRAASRGGGRCLQRKPGLCKEEAGPPETKSSVEVSGLKEDSYSPVRGQRLFSLWWKAGFTLVCSSFVFGQ